MSLRENLLKIERKWSWSFFGFLLAIIFGVITLYTTYFEDKNPNLEFSIESKTTVLDLKKNIKNLDILYKGINIKEQNKNLSIITIKVINNSSVSILKGYYDDLSPVRLSIRNADIVDKPIIINSSNDYLKKNLHLDLDSTGSVYLPPLILEGGEYYTISLLLLHKNNREPRLIPSGKIAGQARGILVRRNYQTKSEKNFGQKLREGNIWVHIVRFIIYLFIFIILIIAIVIPSIYIGEKVSENQKKKKVLRYKRKKNLRNTPETDSVFELYLNNGEDFLFDVQKVISNENRLKIIIRAYDRRKQSRRNESDEPDYETFTESIDVFNEQAIRRKRSNHIASQLDKLNMAKYEKGELYLNQDFKNELNEFISYLKLI